MEFLNRYLAKILTAFAALVAVILLFYVFLELKALIALRQDALPLVAIGGVVILVLLLTAVATMFSILDLTNKDQAMGLPEGSIRAVIALSLIVLFAILSVFLYDSVSRGGSPVTIARMSDADRIQFMRDHPNARDIQSSLVRDSAGEPLVFKDGSGNTILNDDKTPKYVYDLTYRSSNAASEDFAKQILVLLGTLMTAVASFYLGAGTVTSAVKTGTEAGAASTPSPMPGSIKPETHSIAAAGPLQLEITGTNLNIITHVKIVKPGETPIVGTKVGSSPTRITCELDVSKATPGTYDIEIDDGSSKSATLSRKLILTT